MAPDHFSPRSVYFDHTALHAFIAHEKNIFYFKYGFPKEEMTEIPIEFSPGNRRMYS